jgi:hypothetical protein
MISKMEEFRNEKGHVVRKLTPLESGDAAEAQFLGLAMLTRATPQPNGQVVVTKAPEEVPIEKAMCIDQAFLYLEEATKVYIDKQNEEAKRAASKIVVPNRAMPPTIRNMRLNGGSR